LAQGAQASGAHSLGSVRPSLHAARTQFALSGRPLAGALAFLAGTSPHRTMAPAACTEESSTRQRRSATPPPSRQVAEAKAGEAASATEDASGEAASGSRGGPSQRKGQIAESCAMPAGATKTPPTTAGEGLVILRWVQALWTAYLSALGRRPLYVKTATCGAISVVGNVFCQVYVEGAPMLDFGRVMRFGILNIVYVGPVLHHWFGFLNRQISRPGLTGAMLRLLPDQLLMAPVFNFGLLTLLYSSGGQFKTPSFSELWETTVSNWALWPATNLLLFWLVPPDLQLLFGNFVALLWNVYLSTKDASQ